MRTVDLQTWTRYEHFKKFLAFDHPHFGMCANIDLTKFYPIVKQSGHSISVAIVYVLARAANEIPEFRYRIRGEEVVEHDVVHPSFTVLSTDDRFGFCMVDYSEDFSGFALRAAERIASVKQNPTLKDPPGHDNLLFMTALPWVSFTSFNHPMHLNPADSVPRFAWGKFFKESKHLKMPLEVQAHHALMDGIHMGRFYTEVQDYFDHPEIVLGKI
jgi:chloramphenicol O-acetyltransferase type A